MRGLNTLSMVPAFACRDDWVDLRMNGRTVMCMVDRPMAEWIIAHEEELKSKGLLNPYLEPAAEEIAW